MPSRGVQGAPTGRVAQLDRVPASGTTVQLRRAWSRMVTVEDERRARRLAAEVVSGCLALAEAQRRAVAK